MTQDIEGYGARPDQTDIERLLEDCRTLGPSGIERVAQGWTTAESKHDHDAWHEAERAALHVLETTKHAGAWDEVRNRILDLTEHHDALESWRAEHGEVGHRAEDALLGAALALVARPGLDHAHERVLLRPMSAALPWLTAAS